MIHKIIELKYLTAKQAMKLIHPILTHNEQVIGINKVLSLYVESNTLAHIRILLHRIDIRPVNLQIAISRDNMQNINEKEILYSTQAWTAKVHEFKVMNGKEVWLDIGKNIPVVDEFALGWNTGIDIKKKFIGDKLAVQPFLKGSSIQLVLKHKTTQAIANQWQQFHDQYFETTVMIPLNQWISLERIAYPKKTADTIISTYSHRVNNYFIKISIAPTL